MFIIIINITITLSNYQYMVQQRLVLVWKIIHSNGIFSISRRSCIFTYLRYVESLTFKMSNQNVRRGFFILVYSILSPWIHILVIKHNYVFRIFFHVEIKFSILCAKISKTDHIQIIRSLSSTLLMFKHILYV